MNPAIIIVLILLCCAFSILELAEHRGHIEFFIVLTALFVYAAAFRNIYTVPDTLNYVNLYRWIPINQGINPFAWNISVFETGFVFLMYLVKRAGFGYDMFFAVVCLIQLIVYVRAMSEMRLLIGWKRDLYSVYFSIWCGYWGLFYSCIVLRSGLAISFMFLAHVKFLSGRKRRAIIYAITAFLFHRTILLYPFIVFVSMRISPKGKTASIIFLFSVMLAWVLRLQRLILPIMARLAISLISRIFPVGKIVSQYMEYTSEMASGAIGLRVPLMLSFFLMVKPYGNKIYDNMLGIFQINLLFTFLTSSISIGGRLNSICLIVMLPMLCKYLMSGRAKFFERGIVCTVFIVWQFIVSLAITGTS